MCSAHLTRSASLWCPGMSTAKCWNFGHIGVAPSSASSCKVSSTPRAPPAPLLRSFGLWGAPAPLRRLPRQDPPHRAHESSLGLHTYGCTHAPSRQECGEKILKGDIRLGQEYNSRHGGRGAVAWRHLACIGPRGQLIGSDHMTDREADALLYYPLPSLALPIRARRGVDGPTAVTRSVYSHARSALVAGGPVRSLILPSQLTLQLYQSRRHQRRECARLQSAPCALRGAAAAALWLGVAQWRAAGRGPSCLPCQDAGC